MFNVLLTRQGIEQNEYLMRCIVRIYAWLGPLLLNRVPALLGSMAQLLEQVATRCVSPTFAHLLFEGLSVIVRMCAPGASPANGAGPPAGDVHSNMLQV